MSICVYSVHVNNMFYMSFYMSIMGPNIFMTIFNISVYIYTSKFISYRIMWYHMYICYVDKMLSPIAGFDERVTD